MGNLSVIKASTLTPKPQLKTYILYLLECSNGAYYTGYTTDMARRYQAHCTGKGAKYTRSFPPVQLLTSWEFETDISTILKLERWVKALDKPAKQVLIKN